MLSRTALPVKSLHEVIEFLTVELLSSQVYHKIPYA
jgi:hypothetical protein